MAISLDGFITGPDDDPANPAVINGMRLMDWLSGAEKSKRTNPAATPVQPAPRELSKVKGRHRADNGDNDQAR